MMTTRVDLTYTMAGTGGVVTRRVSPVRIMWASRTSDGGAMSTGPVPEPEWLLDCTILELGVRAEIPMARVTRWEPVEL